MLIALLKAFVALIHVVTLGRLRYSRPVEGNALTMKLGDKLWWGYKFYGHPITEPQKDQGIREYFKAQRVKGFGEEFGSEDVLAAPAAPAAKAAMAAPAAQITQAAPAVRAPQTTQTTQTVTIVLGGDILPAQVAGSAATARFWDDVADFLSTANLVCLNLESPVFARQPLSCPTEDIVSPPEMNNTPEGFELMRRIGGVSVLASGGIDGRTSGDVSSEIDREASSEAGGAVSEAVGGGASAVPTVFSTANNHAIDQGVDGLLATIDFLDAQGVPHVGTSRSIDERDNFPIIEVGGIRIAFLSWTFGLNNHTQPEDQEYLVNVLRLNLPHVDITPIATQAQAARSRGADVVVACLHWGLEYESYPTAHQIATGHRIIESGVDIIAGNHPHGLQPVERYTWHDSEGKAREGLIIYALGDLIGELPQVGYSALSALAKVQLRRDERGQVRIWQVTLKPTCAYRRLGGSGEIVDARLFDFAVLKRRVLSGDSALDGESAREYEVPGSGERVRSAQNTAQLPPLNRKQAKAIRKLSKVQEDILPLAPALETER